VLSRRPHLPQINKSKWAAFPGFFHGFRDLDDDLKWQIYTYLFALQTPPPHESVLRCEAHAGFALHLAEPWLDLVPGANAVTVITGKARYAFDAIIMATGFSVDLASRPELARVHDKVLLWGDRVPLAQAARHPHCALSPPRPRLRVHRAICRRRAWPWQHPLLQLGRHRQPWCDGGRHSRRRRRRQPARACAGREPVCGGGGRRAADPCRL
jgi:hypothetical protein